MARKLFTLEEALEAVLRSSDEDDGKSEPEGFDSSDEELYDEGKDPFEDR